MTQLVLNIENPSILPSLKKVLNAIDGVSIAKMAKKSKTNGLDEALEDVRVGRVSGPFNSVEELMDHLMK